MTRLRKLYNHLGDIMVGFWTQIVDWGVVVIMSGVFKIMEQFEQEFRPLITPAIEKAQATGKVPPELEALLGEAKDPSQPIAAFLGMSAAGGATGGLISSTLGPWLKLLEYEILKLAKSARFDPQMAMAILHRRPDLEGEIRDNVLDQGWSETQLGAFIEAARSLLGPPELVIMRRRHGWTKDEYLTAMAKHGYQQDQAEALFKSTEFMPTPQDLVNWQAKEVFEPAMVEKYGLDAELGGLDRSEFYRAGMTDDQIRNYWRAHWQHTSFTQMIELLHREIITEDDMRDWFRLVEVPPKWRDDLIQMAYAIPTRVDARRFWDYRTIDEPRLAEIYRHMGYRGKNHADYMLWTKVYTAWPDLIARYRNGWISLAEVRSTIIAYGMKPERAEELIQTKVPAEAPARTEKERDLTKTDIYKGVKADKITRAQGAELLLEMGYDEWESDYLIEINVPGGTSEAEKAIKELTKGDVKAALKAGQISTSEALNRLVGLRHSAADAGLLVDTWVTSFQGVQEEADRIRTRGDVIKAVKKGLATHSEGYDMLLAIGFIPDEAKFILDVNQETDERSPESFQEFRAVTQANRRLLGKSYRPPSVALIDAERQVLALRAQADRLRQEEDGDELVAPVLGQLAEAEAKYRNLLTA